MNCIDKVCDYREPNGGDDEHDYYFCKLTGIEVDTGNNECLLDKFDKEMRSE